MIQYDLALVIHNGPDQGTVMDRVDKIDEYDLTKPGAAADLIESILAMIRYADSTEIGRGEGRKP